MTLGSLERPVCRPVQTFEDHLLIVARCTVTLTHRCRSWDYPTASALAAVSALTWPNAWSVRQVLESAETAASSFGKSCSLGRENLIFKRTSALL